MLFKRLRIKELISRAYLAAEKEELESFKAHCLFSWLFTSRTKGCPFWGDVLLLSTFLQNRFAVVAFAQVRCRQHWREWVSESPHTHTKIINYFGRSQSNWTSREGQKERQFSLPVVFKLYPSLNPLPYKMWVSILLLRISVQSRYMLRLLSSLMLFSDSHWCTVSV